MDSSLPQLYTILAGFFSLIFLIFYFSPQASKKNEAPEAGGAWPIIGHLHQFGSSKLPHFVFGSMAEKYGPIFTVRLGVKKSLVVSSWEIIKEIFTTNDIVVSGRPNNIGTEILSYNYAMFGFGPYSPYWVELRKIISLEILSPRRLKQLQHVRVSETEMTMKQLYKLWSEKKNGAGRVLVEMGSLFGDLNLNIMLRMVAGKRYYGGDAANNEEARRCRKVMREFFHLLGVIVVADSLPFLRWFDIGGHEKAMKQTAKEMDSIVSGWLEEHQRRRKLSGDENDEHDFMDVMLSVAKNKDFSGFDPDIVTKATCMVLISSGTDTTSVMLTWALSLLLNDRNALKKVQVELDTVVGRERLVHESDLNNLVYLKAVIKETLRLYPAGQLAGQREFSEDCTISGYHVSKGTRLVCNLWTLHRDPRIWSDPTEFKPERFLNVHKDVDVKGKNFELIPFGAGRRLCPGIGYGLEMLHFVLANLLHCFDVTTPTDAPVDMSMGSGLTNAKVTPLEILLAPRLSSGLYQ